MYFIRLQRAFSTYKVLRFTYTRLQYGRLNFNRWNRRLFVMYLVLLQYNGIKEVKNIFYYIFFCKTHI